MTRQLLTRVETQRLPGCRTKVRNPFLSGLLSRHQLKRQARLKSLWLSRPLSGILEQTEAKSELRRPEELLAERSYRLQKEALEAHLDSRCQVRPKPIQQLRLELFQPRKHLLEEAQSSKGLYLTLPSQLHNQVSSLQSLVMLTDTHSKVILSLTSKQKASLSL